MLSLPSFSFALSLHFGQLTKDTIFVQQNDMREDIFTPFNHGKKQGTWKTFQNHKNLLIHSLHSFLNVLKVKS